ncbi:hypothetical protein [Chishuiella sp.]|uniref:hypothetical protein n=1 Tax=Chishuiella sp. TaxID=1969467 RepID=UPI0028AB93AF|nr:hypothetical protein [Chishuiella sp.]
MDEYINSENVEVKYSTIKLFTRILSYAFFFIIGAYILSVEINYNEIKDFNRKYVFLFALSTYLIVVSINKIISNLKNINNKIIFTKDGITVNNTFYNWSKITFPNIISKEKYTSKYGIKYNSDYLTFKHNKQKIEIEIDEYKTNKKKLTAILYSFKKQKTSIHKNIFNELPTFREYIKKDKKIGNEILALCKNNKEELKYFCQSKNSDLETIELIYYLLSEDYAEWNEFLISEFKRIFELSIEENESDKFLPLLESIIPDDISSNNEIIYFLSNKLKTKNIQSQSLVFDVINDWIDSDSINNYTEIIQEVKYLSRDNNWLIRVKANQFLHTHNLPYKNNWLDSLKYKCYKIHNIFK